jgi:starch phosphorylase
VAAVHSQLVCTELVPDFHALWPDKFNNKTNGVTPRRWLLSANPALARLVTRTVGPDWVTDLERLDRLEAHARDHGFREEFLAVKHQNKLRLAEVVKATAGVLVDADSLFDVQVKRIHEYKRQLLNVLHIVHEYLALVEDGQPPAIVRTYLFAGKAAPGYQAAKQIIRLINDVARVINRDARANGYLKVAFIPDYRVSLAECIIPGADLSEQISTAGTEASGTSNMKFAMNGALTIGTLDGANIEIRDAVGPENIFIFGLAVDQVRQVQRTYRPGEIYRSSPTAQRILDSFRDGRFGPHAWVCHKLLSENEPYLHLADLESYLRAHTEADRLYQDRAAWAETAIRNVARIGRFSSDRTIREYAEDIWHIKPVR